jgi:hypothetical protein
MKKLFKNKVLAVIALLIPMGATGALAADGPPGFAGKGFSPEERQERMEQCRADPAKCRAEFQARREQWCKDNAERCKEMMAKRDAMMAECKANPEKCRSERMAHMGEMCKANPERCKEMKANFEKRRAECQANPEKCRAERTARFEQRFKGADADGNGTISRAEAEKAMPRLARHFDRVDANKDGQVTRDEIMAARKAHMERRKPRPEPSKI